MSRFKLAKLSVTVSVLSVSVVLASLYFLYPRGTAVVVQESETTTDTIDKFSMEENEMLTVFYVSETPFPCGPDLEQLCTTLEVAPLLQFARSELPRSVPELTWSDNDKKVVAAGDTAIGAGYRNTLAIIASHTDSSLVSAASFAANHVYDGKDDWYLPSKDELNELCKKFTNDPNAENPSDICTGMDTTFWNFTPGVYWSSSQMDSGLAWYQSFSDGEQNTGNTHLMSYVRVIRAF